MNIKTKILCRLRAKKQLLVLLLGTETAQLSLWQQGERLWQEEQSQRDDEIALADDVEKQTGTVFSIMLEGWLRDVLLAHDVEEGVSMLIVLDDDLLQTEQLTLPKLPIKQLKKTLEWEAGQLFNLPQGSYSYCYQVLAATAESSGQTERVRSTIRESNMQEAEQQVVQLWALEYDKQAEYVALAQRLMVKLEGVCVGTAAKSLILTRTKDGEEPYNDSMLAATIAQSWFAGEKLLLLPALPRRIDWQQCYSRCAQYLPRAAKVMAVCACLAFACSFGLHYLAQADLKDVQQEAERYAVWRERQKESVMLEKQLAKLRQQQEKQKPQTFASKELEQWGRLGLTDIYLTELAYRSSTKQGRQSGVTVAQGVSVSADSLDVLLEKLQTSKQYSSVQLVESQQQAGGVSFKLQLSGTQEEKFSCQ